MEKENVIISQTDATYIFLESVRNMTKLDIQTFDDVDNFLLGNPEKDQEIDSLIRKTDYLESGDLEKNKNIMMYNAATFLKYYGAEQCLKVSSREIEQEVVRAYNYQASIEKYKELYEKTGLKYFASHMQCYLRQLELCTERYFVFKTILESLK